MPAGEKRSCASCTVEKVGQGLPMMGAAGSADSEVWSHPALALPRIAGRKHPYATQPWHCQVYLAKATQLWHCQKKLTRITRMPTIPGTASVFWLSVFFRHSGLALPGIVGVGRVLAIQDWHCQGILAPWPPYVLASPTSHSANCNAACANCNENPIAMPVQ